MNLDQLHYTYENLQAGFRLEQYVYRIGSYHYNWHDDYELFLVLRGEVELCVSGRRILLAEDDVLLINPNEGHASLGVGRESTAMVLHIAPAVFKRYFTDAERLVLQVRSDERTRSAAPFVELRRLLTEMMLFRLRDDAVSRLRFDAAFYQLLALLVTGFSKPTVSSTAAWRDDQARGKAIDRLVAYINEHYRERITLADLAEHTGYNATYISQLFKDRLGINFSEYLTRVRLAAATAELSSGTARIADVAAMHGFSDLKSFNGAFKRTFGTSPAAYRKRVNDDNRASDTLFKQDFIPIDDVEIGAKLASYITAEPASATSDYAAVPSFDDFTQLLGSLSEAERLIGEVSAELRERVAPIRE